MKEYFEANVKYERQGEKGMMQRVNERFIVDCLSFADAEKRVLEEVGCYATGSVNIQDIKRVQYMEIFETTDEGADKFYKVKISIVTIDEDKGVEKLTPAFILVEAANIQDALERMKEGMKDYLVDFELVSIHDTKIMDVYK